MTQNWREDQPIYRQIRDRIIDGILEGTFKEGEALPSVRTVAVELQVNPLTVSKAYQELQQAGVAEPRRGLGLFVMPGARRQLQSAERENFLSKEWPEIAARIRRLGLSLEDLLEAEGTQGGEQ
ncbi:GntR family transcriptional regulator [Pedomonas mirosovicensis]|uniref:GntR family transcriptional regulator n=1 Tax=Pedomonas mirosovicensis TaxID=2908641 RepID=UPI00216A0CE7|nr:GntR family transcriptional regulator [Pedomonas mirosovicensis]MCH8685819.1 GntR family transcriptional regulator [Pedomonas mirosovicensis]